MMTIYGFNFKIPWDAHTITFDTGFTLHFHKCPVCSVFKFELNILGFGLGFAVQRGKAELVVRGQREA